MAGYDKFQIDMAKGRFTFPCCHPYMPASPDHHGQWMAGCNQFAGLCFDCLSADRDKHRLHADTDTQYLACQLLRIPVHGLPVSAFLPVCRFCATHFSDRYFPIIQQLRISLSGGKYIPRFLFHRTGKPVVSTVALLCTSVLFGDDQFQIPVTQKFLCRTYRTLCALLALFRLCVLFTTKWISSITLYRSLFIFNPSVMGH